MTENFGFLPPSSEELLGPKGVKDACWIGWKKAELRERRWLEENERLTREVRELDRRFAELRVRHQASRSGAILSTVMLALAGIFGGVWVGQACNQAPSGQVTVLGIATCVFFALGIIAVWFPFRLGRPPTLERGRDLASLPPPTTP